MIQLDDDLCSSIHEAAHATVGHHFGYHIERLTLRFAVIPSRQCRSPDDRASLHFLLIAAAGNAATCKLLDWEETSPSDDEKRSLKWLRELGAGCFRRRWLIRMTRKGAEKLVVRLKPQILALAAELRKQRQMNHAEIVAAIRNA